MVCMFMYINICISYTNHTHTNVYINNCINIMFQTVSSTIPSFLFIANESKTNRLSVSEVFPGEPAASGPWLRASKITMIPRAPPTHLVDAIPASFKAPL